MKRLHLFTDIFFFITLLTIISASETGDTCQTTDDCPSLHSCTDNICVHKPLFPITAREVIGTIIILTMNALLTAGGVGGGAAYVPYIMLLFSVDLQKAIAYAYACVFGGGVGNFANIVFLKNPKTKRYMINYDICLVSLPALMIGVYVGIILQRMFPPLVTNIILLLVLAYSIYKNSIKLKRILKIEKQEKIQRKEEKQKAIELAKSPAITEPQKGITPESPVQLEEREEAEEIPAMVEYDAEHPHNQDQDLDKELAKGEGDSPEKENILTIDQVPSKNSVQTNDPQPLPSPQDPLLEKRLAIEQKELKFPFNKIGLLLITVVIIVMVGLIRGTKKFDPIVGVDWSCGWDFLWFGLGILFYACTAGLYVYFVHKWQKEKARVHYEFLHEEPHLNTKRITSIMIVSLIAGIIGAIVALGGALIISPTLLDMGMPPAFAAATTGVLLIFSMFNTIFQTILNKKITGIELAWFIPLAIVFSYISSKVVNAYVRRTGRQSIILILMVFITVAGFGCVVYNLINGLIENAEKQIDFTSIC